jgi:hypothetical protein
MPPKKVVRGKTKAQSVKRPKPNVSKVTMVAFPRQAETDFPLRVFDTEGRKKFAELEKKNVNGNKLAAYDMFLLQTHFPTQRRQHTAAQKALTKTNERAQAGRRPDARKLISEKRRRASDSVTNSQVDVDEDEGRSDAVTTSARSGVKVHCDIVCLYMNFKSEIMMHSLHLNHGAFYLHLL